MYLLKIFFFGNFDISAPTDRFGETWFDPPKWKEIPFFGMKSFFFF